MIQIEKSIVINRPVEEVFAYVSDLTHSAEWQSGLVEIRKVTEGILGVGTRYTFVRLFLGRKMEANNEIVEFTPNAKIAFRTISGPIPLDASYSFERNSSDTKLTSKIDMHPGNFISLAEPLISASLSRDVEAGLVYLKGLLESRVTTAPTIANS